MEKFYSNVDGSLLHIVHRLYEIENKRNDLIDPIEFIQCSTMTLQKGKTFKPHKHFYRHRENEYIPQESWVIIKGSVQCCFYDIDDELIAKTILYAGDASFTLRGGHTYLILEDDTIVYEYKTGPYEGQANDKIIIE